MAHGARKGTQLAIRVTEQLLDAIDREVERLRKRRPGIAINRSDVARDCIYRCLKVGIADGQ